MFGRVRTGVPGGKEKQRNEKGIFKKKNLITGRRTITWSLPQIIGENKVNLKIINAPRQFAIKRAWYQKTQNNISVVTKYKLIRNTYCKTVIQIKYIKSSYVLSIRHIPKAS